MRKRERGRDTLDPTKYYPLPPLYLTILIHPNSRYAHPRGIIGCVASLTIIECNNPVPRKVRSIQPNSPPPPLLPISPNIDQFKSPLLSSTPHSGHPPHPSLRNNLYLIHLHKGSASRNLLDALLILLRIPCRSRTLHHVREHVLVICLLCLFLFRRRC